MNNNFRFFDSRQKYLLFVTTTNEKNIIAEKISTQIKKIKPKKPSPPSFRQEIIVLLIFMKYLFK